ncbi:choice-of-anchor E domain-containing protein [Anabaena azotica]|uniref:Choice-of-anchor E domain-containing protein n=1 Tax=Anabaena azotica FACHB-119 TaxID=947527 RepID=A0ABR8CYI2_9NOST|nr:choice-of-anchor E domain-containing protein [Anabaena azotica]MBD2499980.1 choice-of-anchor E domain-containing protein [Anabaena azotica FACHB-119]
MNTKIFNGIAAATTLAGVIATAGTASAASLTQTATFTASTGSFQVTDFDQNFSIQQFSPSLGKLQKVTVDFFGEIQGDGKFENRSSRSATVDVILGGRLSLDQAELTPRPLLELKPTTVKRYNVARYDGTTDYAGASGRTFTGLSTSGSGSTTFTDLASLKVFTGKGDVDFLFSAIANSQVVGSGNISSEINTLARGSVTVTYEYKERVPEPSVVIGMGLFAGLGMLSNRKKQLLKSAKS